MSETNVEIVQRLLDAYNRRDMDTVLALLDREAEWLEDPHVPGAITRRGHAEVKRYLESMHRYWEDLRVEEERFVDCDSDVLALTRLIARSRRGGPEIDRPFDVLLT